VNEIGTARIQEKANGMQVDYPMLWGEGALSKVRTAQGLRCLSIPNDPQ
jgi:hypothetical protein